MALCFWEIVRDSMPSGFRSWVRTLGTGLLQLGYQSLFFLAIAEGTSPGLLSLIVASQPLVTAIAVRARGVLVWCGILGGLLGLAVACIPMFGSGSTHIGGLLCALGALAALTAATMAQATTDNTGLWAGLVIQSTLAVPFFLVLTLVSQAAPPTWGFPMVLPLLWMSGGVGIAATALLFGLARRLGAVAVSSMQFLVPAVTSLLDAIVRGTQLHPLTLGGMAMVTVSLFVFQRGRRSRV